MASRLGLCAALLLGLLMALSAEAWDCTKGCPATATPVCGQDGNTYANECLAVCQGVRVKAPKPCPGSTSRFKKAAGGIGSAAGSAGSSIPVQAMLLHKQKGYKMLGVADRSRSKANGELPAYTQAEINRMAVQATQLGAAGYRSELLDLKTGYLYAGSNPSPPAPSATAAAAAAAGSNATSLPAYRPPALQGEPLQGPSGGRRLSAVFGKDDRTQVFTCAGYPFTAIGQIEFTTDEGSFICSGTLVDENSVLTAGHCVYDNAFITSATFYPGRARTAATSAVVDPYLGWEVTYVSTFTGWTSKKLFTFDAAVMTLEEKPGQYTGWMGITPVASLNKATLLTAGYPGMMPRGTLWRTSCLVTDTNTADQLIKTQLCDFTEGNSGGPAWTVDAGLPKIKGVVSYQSCMGGKCGNKCCRDTGSFNAFVQMGTTLTPSITRWVKER